MSEETFSDTLVILTVAMTTPWGILDQLQNWASILGDHLDKLKLGADVRQQCKYVSKSIIIFLGYLCGFYCRQRLVKNWQEYIELGDDLESPMRRTSRNLGDPADMDDNLDDGIGPLPDGVLTHNLGVDIVVVVTKASVPGFFSYTISVIKNLVYLQQKFRHCFLDGLHVNIRERTRLS